jgi:muramidase (phage lysozyme)
LIGLKVAAWFLAVAAAITKVGTAASVALLGGALGKFLALFGIGAAAAIGMSTEANAGEDAEIARRRAAGTWGPAKAGELEADAAARQKDTRNWWQRTMPKALGGKDAPGAQASAASIPTEGRALLDTIASTEANSYDVMYGGKKFGSYADHPRVNVPITSGPNAGRTSSAAGRYQFLASTWDRQAKKLGLKDFSPASQDVAAWDLAKTDYKRNTGRDLEADLKSNDPQVIAGIGRALSGTWTSLPGGIEQGQGSGRMNRTYQRALERQRGTEVAPAATGAAEDYRRKTGRDLNADLGSSDPHVRKWAAEQAGTSAGSWKRYGDAGIASPERAAADDQAVNDNVARMRKQAAAEDLQKAQTILDVTNFEEQLALADRNAGKATGGGLGDPSAALAPPPASTAGTSVTINQENHMSITGSGDPHDTAQQIGQTQRDVNGGLVRDLKTAVR